MKIIALFSFILMILSPSVHAEIMSVKSMTSVENKILDLLKTYKANEILVAFDIDMTLTQPEHPALYYPALRKYIESYKKILGNLSPEKKDCVSTWVTLNLPQRLVENETPQIIKRLQDKGILTIAFTASLSGSLKKGEPKAIHLRHRQLNEKGIDFTTPFKDTVTFSDFGSYSNSYPMFYKGILSANGEKNTSKGTVFCSFLKVLGYHPKVIVLIDDKKKHLEDMQKKLHACAPSVTFIGIEYQGAYEYAPQSISLEDFEKFWIEHAIPDKKNP